MFKWRKLGRVFNPTEIADRAWLKEFAQAPATLIFDDFVRVYFSCRPPADNEGKYVSYSAYVDLNRTNLLEVLRISEEPILDLGKRGTFDEFGTYPTSVIRDGKDVIAYYGGWTRLESVPFDVSIGVAKSTDNGKTFKRIGDGPVLSSSIHEPFILSGPKIRRFNNKWCLFYIAGTKWIPNNGRPEPVYKIRLAFSSDGLNWNKVNRNLIANKVEDDEAQASPDVFIMNGRYHMFFCYRYSLNYRGKENGYRIGYAVSDDLVNWERNDEMAGIEISESGWDDEMISYPHVFELDGSFYMFYLGNQVGRFGFGLAKLEIS
jgi:hypothetical protein